MLTQGQLVFCPVCWGPMVIKHSLLAYFVVWLRLFLCRSVGFWSSSRYDIAFVFSIKKMTWIRHTGISLISVLRVMSYFRTLPRLCFFRGSTGLDLWQIGSARGKKKIKFSPTQSPPACNLSNNLVTLFDGWIRGDNSWRWCGSAGTASP